MLFTLYKAFSKNKNRSGNRPHDSEEKYFSRYISFTDQISLPYCLYVCRYWEICILQLLLSSLWRQNFEINIGFLPNQKSRQKRLLLKPGPGPWLSPWKSWILKNVDPEIHESWKTWNKYGIKTYVWLESYVL